MAKKKFKDLTDYILFLVEKEIIDENGKFKLNTRVAKGWAEGLDIENWELENVYVPKDFDSSFTAGFTGVAAGDWQDDTRWNLCINDEGKIWFQMFDSPESVFYGKEFTGAKFKTLVKNLE